MDSISAYEAKTHLRRLLDDVSRGKTITITKHGVPIAQLVPAPGAAHSHTREVIAALRVFRQSKGLAGISIRALVDAERRF